MPRTIYRVIIPDNPQKMIELGEAIAAKHAFDGESSLLSFLDMADFEDKVAAAKAQDVLCSQLSNQKDIAFENRDVALGISANVNRTVDYWVKSSRDILVGYYKNHEDKLNLWGFDVSKGSGKVKITIPIIPWKMIKLANDILAKNAIEGANSPIKGLDIVDFTAKTNLASTQHTLASGYKGEKEIATNERNTILGIAANQTLSSEKTVRFYILSIRDVLAGFFKNTEQNLESWGFSVSLGAKPKAVKKSMKGSITDSQGTAIENVQVKVVEVNVIVVTDTAGKYSVPKQPNGIYTIEISKPEYITQTFPNIMFDIKQTYLLSTQLISVSGN